MKDEVIDRIIKAKQSEELRSIKKISLKYSQSGKCERMEFLIFCATPLSKMENGKNENNLYTMKEMLMYGSFCSCQMPFLRSSPLPNQAISNLFDP